MHVDRLLDGVSCRWLDLPVHRRFLFLVLFVFDWLRARLANRRGLLVVRFLDNDRFLKRRCSALLLLPYGTRRGFAAKHTATRILQRHILCKSTHRRATRPRTSVSQTFAALPSIERDRPIRFKPPLRNSANLTVRS